MRVRCVKVKRNGQLCDTGASTWFTVGREYTVLGIFYLPGRPAQYWLVSDYEATPVYSDTPEFEIVDGQIHPSWIAEPVGEGGFHISHRDIVKGFSFEDFVDRKPEAVGRFRKVVAELEEFP